MKITRYPIGRTTLSEKQEERAAVLSPAEAAQAAGAKYTAISSIAGSAAQTIVTLDAANERSKESADRIAEQTSSARTEQRVRFAYDEAKRQNLNDEQLQELVNGILDEEDERLTGSITSRAGQARLAASLQSRRELVNLQTQQTGVILNAQRATSLAEQGITELVAAEDWVGAMSVLDVAVESGAFSVEQAAPIRNELIKGMNQHTIDTAVEKFHELYQTDKEAANEYRKTMLAETDPDTRDAILQGIEGAKQNIDQTQMFEQAKEELKIAQKVSDLITDMEMGARTMTVDQARANFDAGVWGDPESETALRHRDAVINAIQQNTQSMTDVMELQATLKDGLYPNNTPSNREAMDEILKRTGTAEDWTPEQHIAGELALAKATGFASQRATNQFNGMATSLEGFVRGMPLYFAFTADTNFKTDLNIPKPIEGMATSVMELVKENGVPIAAAAEVVWNAANKVAPSELKARKEMWSGTNETFPDVNWSDEASTAFTEEITSGDFKKATGVLWFGQEEVEGTYNKEVMAHAKAQYENIYKMMRVRLGETNTKVIEDFAMATVARNFAMTNVNGDWELMMYAPRHNMEGVRSRMFTDIQQAGTQYQISEDGKRANVDGGELEDDLLRFETIPAREGAFTPEGELKWRVFYDGELLMTADGTAVTVTADLKGMEDYALAKEDMDKVAEEVETLQTRVEGSLSIGEARGGGAPTINAKSKALTQALEARTKVLTQRQARLNEVSF